jgi:hypothetical protein
MTAMITRLVQADYVAGHRVWLRFDDGVSGEIDLAGDLEGPVFEPLKRVEAFRQFSLSRELHTLVWPNGADFAPEFLREKLARR